MNNPLALRVDATVFEPKSFRRSVASSPVSPLLADTPRFASTSFDYFVCGARGSVIGAMVIPDSRKMLLRSSKAEDKNIRSDEA